MKVPLVDQIAHAERTLNGLRQMAHEGVVIPDGPSLEHRLNCQEGICLTLRWLETYEAPFRQYMAQRSKDA